MIKSIKLFSLTLIIIFSEIFAQVGNEFPIEVGSDSCYATGYAEDDTKYMIVMRKEKGLSGADIVIQFHSKTNHSLIGSPIVLGSTNVPFTEFESAIPQAAFDGTRFLVVWSDIQNGGIKYRFIHSQTFELSQLYSDLTLPAILGGINALHFNSSTNKYLLVFGVRYWTGDVYLFYNFIQPNGFMSNSNQLVNFPTRRELSFSYANGKYLICFIKEANQVSDYEVYGQFLNENGTLSGSTFLIDGTTYPTDNPLYVVFDGNYYICIFPEEEQTGWKIYAKRITPNGIVDNQRYLITQEGWLVPLAAVGNNKILITWLNPMMGNLKGKFFDFNLSGIGNEFVVFNTLNGKFPFGNELVYDGGKFYCFTTRVDIYITPDSSYHFTNGDIYGVPIFDPTYVKNDANKSIDFVLHQNFPNPFNPTTKINFSLKEDLRTTLKIYDLFGKEITTLVDQNLESGLHTIEFNPEKFGLSGGVYFYQINAGSFKETKKMIYIK